MAKYFRLYPQGLRPDAFSFGKSDLIRQGFALPPSPEGNVVNLRILR